MYAYTTNGPWYFDTSSTSGYYNNYPTWSSLHYDTAFRAVVKSLAELRAAMNKPHRLPADIRLRAVFEAFHYPRCTSRTAQDRAPFRRCRNRAPNTAAARLARKRKQRRLR